MRNRPNRPNRAGRNRIITKPKAADPYAAEIAEAPSLDVLLVPVGREPVRVKVKKHWRAYQRLIGGQYYTWTLIGPGVELLCAEDIHVIEDQPNGCGLYGAYFFVGTSEGQCRSLTEEEFRKCLAWWAAKRHERQPSPEEVKGSLRSVVTGSLEHLESVRQQREAAIADREFWDSL